MIFVFAGIVALAISVILGVFGIPLLSKIKAGQPILSYVEEHKEKSGTPTMGGLFFVMAAVLAYFFFAGRSGRISYVVIAIGIAYLIVGFLDDFIKIKNRHNLGLRAYQKILFFKFFCKFPVKMCICKFFGTLITLLKAFLIFIEHAADFRQ